MLLNTLKKLGTIQISGGVGEISTQELRLF